MSSELEKHTSEWFRSDKRGANQYEAITRDRALFASVLVLPIYVAFATVNYWINDAPLMAATSAAAALFTLCALLLNFFCVKAYLGGHCFTLALAVQVFGEMVLNGGLQAPAAALSLLIVPAAIFTAGAIAVRPWALITIVALLAIFMLDLMGGLPPNELNPKALKFDRIFSLAAGIFISAAVVIQFERQATHAIDKLVEQRASFRHRALHDSLTGLPNRSQFYEHAEQSIDSARKSFTERVIIYFDIDRFKQINDQHGHATGDALLKAFAARLTSKVRPDDLAARLAGDEFAMIANTSNSEASTDSLTRRLRAITDEPFELDGLVLNVSMSIGFACFPADGDDLDALLRVADSHMYANKSERRNSEAKTRSDNVYPMPAKVAGNLYD